MNIISIPSPNHFVGRAGHVPQWIICHGTAGGSSAENTAHYFQSANVSSNFVIDQAGVIVESVSPDNAAWGNGALSAGHDPWWNPQINPNLQTISIEHVKPSEDNSDELTEAQKRASFALIASLCDRYPSIPRRKADSAGGITGHYSIDPVDRARCPGPYPWDELFTFLSSSSSSTTQGDDMLHLTDPLGALFHGDDTRWTCPATTHTITGGILTYFRQIQGAPRLPLTDEQYTIPNVVWQSFECGIICYDPKRVLDNPPIAGPCYLVKLDSELGKHILGTATAPSTALPASAQVQDAISNLKTIDHAGDLLIATGQQLKVTAQHAITDLSTGGK